MKLGFFTMPLHPLEKDWRVSLREDREAFILADELGFVEGYVGEHVTDKAENITSCITFIATLVDATKRIKLGTGTINMPNAHPAADGGQHRHARSPARRPLHLRHLAGRAAVGRGGVRQPRRQPQRDVRGGHQPGAGDLGRRCALQHQGQVLDRSPPSARWCADIGQGILAKPLQKPHPPIVVTVVAPFSQGVTEAASRGWEPISANFLMPAWVKSHWPKYVEGCEKGGRPADPANWRVARSIFVADSDKQARDYVMAPNSPYRLYFDNLVTKLKMAGRAEPSRKSATCPTTPSRSTMSWTSW